MKLTIDFPSLDDLRKRMDAPLSRWTLSSPPISRTTVEPKPLQGEVSVGDVTSMGGIGPLVYQGQQVLLHIKDTSLSRWTLENDPRNSRRFHIADCLTLKEARRDNWYDKYVWTVRTDGKFKVDGIDPNGKVVPDIDAKLYVCKHCLNALELKQDIDNWPEFSIVGFFRDNETFFHNVPRHSDITYPLSDYPKGWDQIKRTLKERQKWTCEECKVYLGKTKQHQSLLHCHHKNRVKRDIRPENLQALCVECHNEQPQHGRHPPSKGECDTLAELRAVQGLPAGQRKSIRPI